jgi:hypothetical protein
MNRREKILASCIGGLLGVFVLGFGVRAIIVKPLQEIDKRSAALRGKLDKAAGERRAYFDAEDRMKAFTLRSFADTPDQASAKSGELLTKLILKSGLPEDEFSRLPLSPRKLRGAQEIGWNVQGDGGLADVIDLIFSLQSAPYLQRIEGLTVGHGEAPGLVRVRFRYLTLVMDPAPDVQRKELVAKYTLESPERHIFDGIVSRDVLRPYIKRPPPPPPPVVPGTAPGSGIAATKPGAIPGPETFRIVSLSEWMGQPEIHVRDLTYQKTQRYKPGDQLAGGTIVCVDYRQLPMPGNELLRSDSRVIVKVGGDYFAIERGKTLADKRKLTLSQLPSELAKAK